MESYAIISVIIVSLISLLAALPLLIKKEISKKTLFILLSGSVGVLLATVFMDLLPEAIHEGYDLTIALYILSGLHILILVPIGVMVYVLFILMTKATSNVIQGSGDSN